jgi:hypothetical protein
MRCNSRFQSESDTRTLSVRTRISRPPCGIEGHKLKAWMRTHWFKAAHAITKWAHDMFLLGGRRPRHDDHLHHRILCCITNQDSHADHGSHVICWSPGVGDVTRPIRGLAPETCAGSCPAVWRKSPNQREWCPVPPSWMRTPLRSSRLDNASIYCILLRITCVCPLWTLEWFTRFTGAAGWIRWVGGRPARHQWTNLS